MMSLEIPETQKSKNEPSKFLHTESMKNAMERVISLTSEDIEKELKGIFLSHSSEKIDILITGEGLNLIDEETIKENVITIFNEELQGCIREEENEKERLKKYPNSSTTSLKRLQNKKEVCQQYIEKCADYPDFPLKWYEEIKEKLLNERLSYYNYLYQLSESFTSIYGSEVSEQDIRELSNRTLIYLPYTFNIFAEEEAHSHYEVGSLDQHILWEGYNVRRTNVENSDTKTPVVVKMDFYPDLEVENDELTLIMDKRNKEVLIHEALHNLAKEKIEVLNVEGKYIYCITNGFVRTYFDEFGKEITPFGNYELIPSLPDNMKFLDEATVMLLEQVVISGEKPEIALDKISKRFDSPFQMGYQAAKHYRAMVEVAKIIGIEKIAKAHLNSDMEQLFRAIENTKGGSYLVSFLERVKAGGIEYYYD